MRRIDVDTVEERRIRAPLDAVRQRLDDIEGAIWLLPSVSRVEVIPPEGNYLVHLGPFGFGSFQGTIRLELRVVESALATAAGDVVALRLETVPEGGNTDARIAFEARADGPNATMGRCTVWTQPRKDIPALLPITLVKRAAVSVLTSGIEDALDGFAASFGGGVVPGPPQG